MRNPKLKLERGIDVEAALKEIEAKITKALEEINVHDEPGNIMGDIADGFDTEDYLADGMTAMISADDMTQAGEGLHALGHALIYAATEFDHAADLLDEIEREAPDDYEEDDDGE